MVRYCSNCGTRLEEEHAFCESCGAPAPKAVQESAPEASQASAPSQNAVASDEATAAPYEVPTGPIFNAGLPKKASGMAIASLVLGIISIVASMFVVGILFGIVAIILFALARKKYGKSGIGLAGMITGIVGSVLSLIIGAALLIVVVVFSSDGVQASITNDPNGIDFYAEDLSEANLIGTWYLHGAYIPSEDEGSFRNSVFSYEEAQAINAAGGNATLTFYEDETFELAYGDSVMRGEWDVDEYHADLEFSGEDNDIFIFFYNSGEDFDPAVDSEFNELAMIDSSSALFEFEK